MLKTDNKDSFDAVNDLAIKWFEIHADQRLKVFNFYLLIAGFSTGGFFAALQSNNHLAASIVGVVLAVVSYCFKQLDRRTVQLTKLAEDYLDEALSSLEVQINSTKANFVRRAEDKKGLWSYRKTFNVLFWLFGILGLLGAAYAWLQPKMMEIAV